MSRSFGERNLTVTGAVGTVLLALVLFGGFNYSKLPFFDQGRHFAADFSEAGAIQSGDDVLVSGLKVGSVNSVRLSGARVVVGFTITASAVHVGDMSTAAIVTETVLGKAGLGLTSHGTPSMHTGSTIPLSRTTSPYDLTEALSDLTNQVGEIDTTALVKALSTVAGTFSGTPSILKSALNGVARISQTISSRDAQLHDLFSSSAGIAAVLSQRNQQISALLGDGTQLLAQLNARHDEINALFVDTTAVSTQLKALIDGAGAKLKPALDELDQVTALLNTNKVKLEQAIEGLHSYIGGLADAASSGPYFDGYIENLAAPASLFPVLSGILAGSSKATK